jgi:hypothetical protein
MDRPKDRHQETTVARTVAGRKPYAKPHLTIYGNFQQITGMVGTSGLKDGAVGQMNVRTSP